MAIMSKLRITGGRRLGGIVRLAGAKNAIGKLIVASLLTAEPVTIENAPDHQETAIALELCRHLGSRISRRGGTITMETPRILQTSALLLTRRNRLPILALGPLLARTGAAAVPLPGGDRIGTRPVDFHIATLERLGATIELTAAGIQARAAALRGAALTLPYPSVGATESALMASVLAHGRTAIANAAIEPEITDLVKLLQNMGAIIEFGANRSIHIEGVPELHGATHRVLPDRIEAASFAVMALASGGEVMVEDAVQEHLITFLNAIRRIGANYEVLPHGIRFFRERPLRPLHIETDTHPGFMTDWQQPFAVLLTQSAGESVIHETVYEDRFGYAEDLRRMGAAITVIPQCLGSVPCRFQGKLYNHTALIRGPTPLRAAALEMRDIRAGMTHIIASLIAEGTSELSGLEHVDRGYERIEERIRSLGAAIERVPE